MCEIYFSPPALRLLFSPADLCDLRLLDMRQLLRHVQDERGV